MPLKIHNGRQAKFEWAKHKFSSNSESNKYSVLFKFLQQKCDNYINEELFNNSLFIEINLLVFSECLGIILVKWKMGIQMLSFHDKRILLYRWSW